MDLIDSENSDIDRVSGFTIKQLENILGRVTSWESWQVAVKDIYSGDDADIDRLFNYYKDK